MPLNNDFIKQIEALLPHGEAHAMLDAIDQRDVEVAVRFNNAKCHSLPTHLERVPWCEWGAYLAKRPQFTFDPMLHAGAYYVQDASSMFIYHVIKSLVHAPVRYLDLCAAPGGKTTAALQALPAGSAVVANEIVPPRAHVLRENVIKWGNPACMVTCDNPRALGALTNMFDVIAADVPCSGEGMFRKDDEAIAQWSPALVEQCSARQRVILADVWNALKPGGLLIYSTCTYNRQENEEIVQFIINELGATPLEVPIQSSWNIHGAIECDVPCYRFMPHITRGEGLFVCVLRKNSGALALTNSKKDKKKVKKSSQAIPAEVKKWVTGNNDFAMCDNIVFATPQSIKEMVEIDTSNIHVIKPFGVALCESKGKKTVPCHHLAMSTLLQQEAFPLCEVDYPTAIAYLRGEALTIDAPRGYVLITYRNASLGFVNNLGNRANNLYPKPWRIMSSHVPEQAPAISGEV